MAPYDIEVYDQLIATAAVNHWEE